MHIQENDNEPVSQQGSQYFLTKYGKNVHRSHDHASAITSVSTYLWAAVHIMIRTKNNVINEIAIFCNKPKSNAYFFQQESSLQLNLCSSMMTTKGKH